MTRKRSDVSTAAAGRGLDGRSSCAAYKRAGPGAGPYWLPSNRRSAGLLDLHVWSVRASVYLFGDFPPSAPIVLDDRVEDLVEILSVTHERLPECGFLHRSRLEQRRVAPSVQHGHARLQPMHTERFERELENLLGAVKESARPPERRPDGKSPVRCAETPLGFANLEDPDCGVGSLQRDGEARIRAGRALPQRPRDEALEAFNR